MLHSKLLDQLIDVNLNRLSEALKVLEDLTRFYFKDYRCLIQIRILKRKLWDKFGPTRKQVLWARKSRPDLGRKPSFDINKRGTLVDMLTVNFKRCQESSRVLEETFKVINSRHAGFIKNIRFSLYDLEKELFKQIEPEFNPRIYVILDISTIGRKHLAQITKVCITGGATMIQLRETKGTTTRQWLSDACKIKTAIIDPKVKFVVNNRVDVAMAVNADGIHIGKEDLSITDARKLLGDEKIIGVTVRNVSHAKQAEKQGANYIGVGAIFPSPTKITAPVVGIKILQQIVKAVKIPVVAIGGINSGNAKQVFKIGASGIAVISSVFQGIDFQSKNFSKKIIKNLKAMN